MKLFRERSGIISEQPVWVCFANHRIFIHDRLLPLVWLVITEWNDDRHLIG